MLGYALRANPTYNVHEVGHRNAQGISSYPTAVITSRLSRFIIAPADAMSGALIRPLPKIIALGGVATGSMNAQLAAKATMAITRSGSSPRSGAAAANTGTRVAVVAILLVSSVKSTTKPTITVSNMIGDIDGNPDTHTPIASSAPVALIVAARLKPPPNKISVPHGNSRVSGQSRTNLPALSYN